MPTCKLICACVRTRPDPRKQNALLTHTLAGRGVTAVTNPIYRVALSRCACPYHSIEQALAIFALLLR